MAIYKLKQKFLSLTEKFEIKDDQGEPIYTINGKIAGSYRYSRGSDFRAGTLVKDYNKIESGGMSS